MPVRFHRLITSIIKKDKNISRVFPITLQEINKALKPKVPSTIT